jgi:lactoylglutathione lyase
MAPDNRQFAHTALTVADLDTSIAFYASLGFQHQWTHELSGRDLAQLFGLVRARARTAYLVLGANGLELYQFIEPVGRDMAKVMRPCDRGIMHISVQVPNLDVLFALLSASGYETYSDPVLLQSGARAMMVRDPDGIAVELFQAAE